MQQPLPQQHSTTCHTQRRLPCCPPNQIKHCMPPPASHGLRSCARYLHPTATSTSTSLPPLQVVQSRFSFAVLLVDLLDASSTLLASLRTLVGANPVLLVATKADLLPEGTQPGRLVPWLSHLASSKRLKLAGVHVVSSATGEGARLALAPCSSAHVRGCIRHHAAVMGLCMLHPATDHATQPHAARQHHAACDDTALQPGEAAAAPTT